MDQVQRKILGYEQFPYFKSLGEDQDVLEKLSIIRLVLFSIIQTRHSYSIYSSIVTRLVANSVSVLKSS